MFIFWLTIVIIINFLVLFAFFFNWIISISVYMIFPIIFILIISVIVANNFSIKKEKIRLEEQCKYISDIDSDAKNYQIIYDNCINNKETINYYKDDVLKKFVNQTNDKILNLCYQPYEQVRLNAISINIDNATEFYIS